VPVPARGAALRPWAALLLLAAGAACAPQQAATPAIPRASGPEQLAGRLPEEAAGFRRGANAPVTEPFTGREVAYATGSRNAAAFVQVLAPPSSPGAEPLPDGPNGAAAQAEFARWRDETARGTSPSRSLRVTAEADRAGLFRCADLEGTYGRQPVSSMLCVGAAAGQLLRVRLSMPRRDFPAADSAAFLSAIAASLR
jgi:hypothetical protein